MFGNFKNQQESQSKGLGSFLVEGDGTGRKRKANLSEKSMSSSALWSMAYCIMGDITMREGRLDLLKEPTKQA